MLLVLVLLTVQALLYSLLDQLYPGQNIIISNFQVFDKKEKSEPLVGFFRVLVGYL